MNFYKHHLGDYDGATAHLSWDEDMAYTRLLRAYYRREKAIPDAEKYRLVRAASRPQRAAVDSVLSEFFDLLHDGWHNKRADEEIATYQAQADTNRRIAEARERKRIEHEPTTNRATNRRTNGATILQPNHKPDTRSQNQEPEPEKTLNPLGEESPNPPLPVAKRAGPETRETWHAYKRAYSDKYNVEPVQNKTVNSQMKSFVERVGVQEAPAIARYYLGHNGQTYTRALHPVRLLLYDAEKLRTEWATQQQMTEARARDGDRLQAQGDVWRELLTEAACEPKAH